MKNTILAILFLTLNITSFSQEEGVVDEVYIKRLDNWQRDMTRWKQRNFVPLIGLHLLKEGDNTFGKNPDNDIVVESRNALEYMGKIVKKGKSVTYISNGKDLPGLEGKEIEQLDYTFDGDRNSERLKINFVKWYVQYVGKDYFLRVMDEASPLIAAYESPEYYPASQEFIFEGHFEPFKKKKNLMLDNVIGTQQSHEFIGEVTLKHEGKKYKLWVLNGYFLMFTDLTNDSDTFPYGRYLRLNKPDEKGNVMIDFNLSFSPPRSSSLFTTCDLPPARNHLPFAIEAGEKYEPQGEIIRPVKH